MGKVIVFLLGAAAIAYGAYRFIPAHSGAAVPDVARPLDHVRQKAKEIERDGQQRAAEAGREPDDFAEQQRQDEQELQRHVPDPPPQGGP